MLQAKSLDLFACIQVADYPSALKWYEQLLGYAPTFVPDDHESVWELAEHRFLYVEHEPKAVGQTRITIFVDDLDTLVAGITGRGIDPLKRETYDNGVRKITYRDAEGNEIGFGGAPL